MDFTPREILRWSGVSFGAGAILFGISVLAHPAEGAHEVSTSITRVFILTLAMLGWAAILLGSVGYYLQMMDRAGPVGLAGFGLFFIGSLLQFVYWFLDALVWRELADSGVGVLLAVDGPVLGGTVGVIFSAGFLAFSLGAIMLGWFASRETDLPKFGSWMVIGGAPLLAAGQILIQGRLEGFSDFGWWLIWIGAVVFAVGAARSGWDMWTGPEQKAGD